MLETVHEFAREKLQGSGEAEQIKRVHAEYFLTLAEEANQQLKAPDQVEWLERLEAEHDNMRAALSWALEHKAAEEALRLGGALSWFWLMRGHYSEGRRWLEGALAMDRRGAPEVRAMAQVGVGALAQEQGDFDRAEETCEEGLELLGCLDSGVRFLGWVKRGMGSRGKPNDLSDQFTGLVLDKDGIYEYRFQLVSIRVEGDCWAIGSGAQAALGAMYMGATPEEAAEVACAIDPFCGGPVKVERL